MEAGCTVHVESAGADDHHVAEAAYKALGQALRQAVAPGRAGDPLDEGRGVKVVIADYGAGNLRSLSAALTRAGAEPVVTTDPGHGARGAARADRRRRSRRERRGGARASTDSTRRCASASQRDGPSRGSVSGMQLLFERSEEGGEGLGLLAGPVRRVRARRVPHMGWNTLATTRPSAILDGLEGSDVYFAHSFVVEPEDETVVPRRSTTTGRSSLRSRPGRSPVSSSIPSGAARPVRASSRTSCDGQEARDPLSRRRGRSRRQGRAVREAPGDGRARRARYALLRARRGRARLPRHHRHARRAGPDTRRDRALRRAAGDSLHGRRRRDGSRRCPSAASGRRRQGRGQSRRVRRPVDADRARPRVRCAGRRLRDRRPRRRGRDARGSQPTRPGRRRLGARGRRARRGRDPAHLDRRRRNAGGLRPAADPGRGRRRGGAGDRVRRSGRDATPRRGLRGRRRGGAGRVDRARAPGAAAGAESRAARRQDGRSGRDADARRRPGRGHEPRADARVRERRGAATHAGDRGGLVLEPLPRRALAQGRDVGQHAWPSRRSRTTATATRCSTACDRTGLRATPARSRASRRGCGASWRSGRSSGRHGSYVVSLLEAGPAAAARKVGEEGLETALAGAGETDERLVEELADLWFHSYVLLAARGLQPSAVEDELRRRHARA